MKKFFCLFFIFLITGLLFSSGLAEDKESYDIYCYFSSNLHYPGEKIPVNLSLYYYNIKKKGNFEEKVDIKIYKIPSDLPSDKMEGYCLKNSSIEELKETVKMENYGSDYWSGYSNIEIPSLESGNYCIICSTDEKKYVSSFRVSKIAMSVKASKEFLLLFLQDIKTGKALENIEVSFYTKETKKFKTDKDGIIKIYYKDLKNIESSGGIRVIAVNGEDTAEVNLSVPEDQEIFKGYIYTDRPVYRPSQKVNFKGILRIQKGDSLNYAKEEVNVSIYDTQNSEIYKNTLKTDDYGTISDSFTLKSKPPLGNYSINCLHRNGQRATGNFQVEEYRKPEFEIKVTPDKEQYIQGEKMKFNMEAKYYFGSPVPDTDYTYEIYRNYYYPWRWNYWWEEECMPYYYKNYQREYISSGKGKTDKEGKAVFTCDAAKVDYDSNYTVMVRMTDESRREVTGSASALITRGAFYITITPEKYFYKPGDKVHMKVEAKDYSSKAVETVLALKTKYESYNERTKSWEWKDVDKAELKTLKTGIVYYDFVPDKDGYYEMECNGTDIYKNEIKSTGYVYCYSGEYYNWYRFSNVEIIPDKNIYEPGETASFFLVCPFPVKALVTVEGEEIFTQKTIDFSNKTGSLSVKITPEYTPDFFVTVSFFYEGNFYYQTKKIICPSKDKFLTVSIESDKEKYRPRDTAKFILKTLDSNNRPVTSQVTMGLADESVYAVVSDSTPNIQKFFYGLRGNTIYTYGSNGSVYGGVYYYYNNKGGYDEETKEQKTDSSAVMARGEIMKTPGPSGGEKPLVQPDFTRSYFPDTAYFNPNIITDQNGKAEVFLSMPDTLTTWRATARSVSKDTKVGENTKKVIVSKNLLARLITPRFFTERDETVVTGIVHNYLNSEKTVHAKVEIDGGIELSDKADIKAVIPPNGSKSLDWKVKVKRAGNCKIKLSALTDEESDAVELTIPVLPHGTEKYVAAGGVTKDVKEEKIILPKDAEKGSAKCIITLDPSLASTVFSSLDYLVGYPYGCVEQTMSRFLPNVIVTKTLGELDIYNEKMNKELPEMVEKGFERLYNFHHPDGGWGWWENDASHPYMTAYVVYGLILAKEAGYSVDESKIKEGAGWLREHYGKEENINTRAYMVFALTTAGEDCKDWLLKLYEKREKLDSYGKAVLALSLDKSNLKTEAKEVVKLLENTAEISGTTVSWSGMTGSHGWTDNQVETTSYCLMALLKIKPESELIPKVVRFLSVSRNGNCWYSTKDTAAAVMALTGYIKNTREMNPDFTATVYFNGTKLNSYKFTKEDVGKAGQKIEIPFDRGLLDGENKVRFEVSGKGLLYYAVYMKYYTGEENVKPLDSGFKVTRTYYLLKAGAKDPEKEKIKLGSDGNIEVKSQDIIQVELNISGASNYEYIIIEDPKPAGCEYDEKQRGNATEWNYWYSHKELRDEKIAYFCTYYRAGAQKVTYRLRAETPGTFHVMPARASAMYSPEIGGNSDEIIMKIKDNK